MIKWLGALLLGTAFTLGASLKTHAVQNFDMIPVSNEPIITYTKNKETIVDLGQQIHDELVYLDLIDQLREAKKDDVFIFKLHNAGGAVDGMAALIGAIDATKAKTIADVIVSSKSAAAIIACHTSEIKMTPYTYLMFHDMALRGAGGKSSELTTMLYAERQLYRNAAQACKKHGLLTDQEIENILNGQDIYKYSTDLKPIGVK